MSPPPFDVFVLITGPTALIKVSFPRAYLLQDLSDERIMNGSLNRPKSITCPFSYQRKDIRYIKHCVLEFLSEAFSLKTNVHDANRHVFGMFMLV